MMQAFVGMIIARGASDLDASQTRGYCVAKGARRIARLAQVLRETKGVSPRMTIPFAFLASAGEVVADALDGVALSVVEGEEFEAVAEALAVADDGADLDGIGSEG